MEGPIPYSFHAYCIEKLWFVNSEDSKYRSENWQKEKRKEGGTEGKKVRKYLYCPYQVSKEC